VPALALLLLLHLVAIGWLVRLQTTRERPLDRLVTLLRFIAPNERLPAREPLPMPATQAPRPLLAPLPTIAIAPDDAAPAAMAPVAGPPSSAPAGTGAASGVGPDKLDLRIPKEFYTHPPPLTPAQEAMRDPRSNKLVLTKQEQMDVDFGVVECIAWQREPNGSIYRGPGHWQRIQGIGTNPFTAHKPGTEDRNLECVK
jgi:hypothetical protein